MLGHTFRPGALWPDDHGTHINAHGGGVMWHAGVYYWFGEHKIAGEAGIRKMRLMAAISGCRWDFCHDVPTILWRDE